MRYEEETVEGEGEAEGEAEEAVGVDVEEVGLEEAAEAELSSSAIDAAFLGSFSTSREELISIEIAVGTAICKIHIDPCLPKSTPSRSIEIIVSLSSSLQTLEQTSTVSISNGWSFVVVVEEEEDEDEEDWRGCSRERRSRIL